MNAEVLNKINEAKSHLQEALLKVSEARGMVIHGPEHPYLPRELRYLSTSLDDSRASIGAEYSRLIDTASRALDILQGENHEHQSRTRDNPGENQATHC